MKKMWNRRTKTLFLIFVSAGILLLILAANRIIPSGAVATDFSRQNTGPSFGAPFGTDWLGRDMFLRTVKGLALSIRIGAVASALSVIIAVALGMAAATLGKAADALVCWLADLFLGIPHLVLLILISFAMGGGARGVIVGVAVTHWPALTRVIRAEVLQLRTMEFVRVSRQFGKKPLWIAGRHILPHLFPQIFVGLILLFPHAILHEAGITFLGFGLSPHTPAVGIILSESMKHLATGLWWLAFFPGLSLLLIVRLFDVIGENLRALLSPRTAHAERKKTPDAQAAQEKAAPAAAEEGALLEVKDLSVSFEQYGKGLRKQTVSVISGLNLSVRAGKITAVAGSSGSGKSLLVHAILGILPENARCGGTVAYDGKILTEADKAQLRGREIAFIPQTVNALDPLMKAGAQVRCGLDRSERKFLQEEAFARYELTDAAGLYPFQLSGGMARRVLVASAVAGSPRLILADEPTPGLHPEIAEEALLHLKELAEGGCGVLMITHDIEAALKIADEITVFYAGATMETAPAADFAADGSRLRHPYSKALWKALPQNEFIPIGGFQPSALDLPSGCLFAPRCPERREDCLKGRPEMRILRDGKVWCNHAT